jgi:hypothetical protein
MSGKEGHEGDGDNEASQRSTATFQNINGKQDDGRGCKQSRVADSGPCAAREDRGQERALWGESHRSGTRYRWNQCRGRREPGCKDDLARPPRGFRKMVTAEHGQGCSISRSSLQVPLSAEQEGLRLTSSRATTIKDRKEGCIIL